MTLEEAIELTKAAAEDMELYALPRFGQAVRLGREALKRVGMIRKSENNECFECAARLPGETEGEK